MELLEQEEEPEPELELITFDQLEYIENNVHILDTHGHEDEDLIDLSKPAPVDTKKDPFAGVELEHDAIAPRMSAPFSHVPQPVALKDRIQVNEEGTRFVALPDPRKQSYKHATHAALGTSTEPDTDIDFALPLDDGFITYKHRKKPSGKHSSKHKSKPPPSNGGLCALLSPKSYKQSSSSSDSNSNSTTNSDSKFKSVNSFDPLQQDFHRAKSN